MDGRTDGRTNERTDIRITIYPRNLVCRGYNNAFSLYDLYSYAPAQKPLPLDPSLVIITIHLVCLNHAPE